MVFLGKKTHVLMCNKSDDIGHVPESKLSKGTTMEIFDNTLSYDVETSSWSTFSYFSVNKITGKISRAGHKHYDRSDVEKDEYEIID